MFGRRVHLFTILGLPVRADISWFIVAALLSGSYATQYLPALYPDFPTPTHWAMATSLVLGLFGSVLLHELAHALAARRYEMPMEGITLFVFGGVAELSDEPPHPRAEFVVAVAGPILSILLGTALGVLWLFGEPLGLAPPVLGLLGHLAAMNLALVAFNMIPAFPLDGGRVLRSILWDWRKDLVQATRVTSSIGSMFGVCLILFGGFLLLTGALVAGIWNVLIGMFLRHAARLSYRQVQIRQALEGEPVSRFMHERPVTVPRSISVESLVREFVVRYRSKIFPVVDGDRLVGCITTNQVRRLPREEWARQSVGAIAESCAPWWTISPDADAVKALIQMSSHGVSRLLVADGDRLVGVLSLGDLIRFFTLKRELDGSR